MCAAVAALLKSFDVVKQIERLESPEVRALGPPKHRLQVREYSHRHRLLPVLRATQVVTGECILIIFIITGLLPCVECYIVSADALVK